MIPVLTAAFACQGRFEAQRLLCACERRKLPPCVAMSAVDRCVPLTFPETTNRFPPGAETKGKQMFLALLNFPEITAQALERPVGRD